MQREILDSGAVRPTARPAGNGRPAAACIDFRCRGERRPPLLHHPRVSGSLPVPKAIRIHETGGPEVLRWEEVEVG